MNKCFYLSTKEANDFFKIEDTAKNCGIEMVFAEGEFNTFSMHYHERCPILVDDRGRYEDIVNKYSSFLYKDVYLLCDNKVYQNDLCFGDVKQFFLNMLEHSL